jgi:hypothetical protein
MNYRILTNSLIANGKNFRNSDFSTEVFEILQTLKVALSEELNCTDPQTYFITEQEIAIYSHGKVLKLNRADVSLSLNDLILAFDSSIRL